MVINVLNVAEKPKVAKEISYILGKGKAAQSKGYSKYNPIFKFPYTLNGENCNMIFTSVLGHLLGRDFNDNVRKWYSCNPSVLFDEPIQQIVPDNMKQIDKTLQQQAKSCQWLVLWLDFDREGENISFEVISRCTKAKRNLKIFRAKFSSLIPREIYHACTHLIPPDKNKSDAAEARCELDLRVGSAFTRLQTMFLQKKIPDLENLVISYGPCQFPTLGFVVDRYWRIEEFVEEPFWAINVSHKRENSLAKFSWERGRLFDYATAFILYEMVVESPIAKVTNINQKKKDKWKPYPLNTIALQKLASRKLRMNSSKVMEVAENLYRQGFISYPRTETNSFDTGTNLKGLIEIQAPHPQWGSYANSLLQEGKFCRPRNGKSNDQSHPPIHPTKLGNINKDEEKKLYELVVRHFLACCSEDAHGFETTVSIDIANEKFTTKGLMITATNYLDVYPYDKWSEKTIPVFREGEQFTPTEILFHNGQTQPPNLLTESELIDLMDKNGIGTDATIAQHIQTIQQREYASKEGNYFTPTTLGLALIDGYKKMGFNLDKPDLRARMEKDLEQIAAGKIAKNVVTAKFVSEYREIFEELEHKTMILAKTCQKYFKQQQ